MNKQPPRAAIDKQVRLDASNQWAAYTKGWSAGAGMRAMDPAVKGHPDAKIEIAYELGYAHGRDARSLAHQDAAERYGYTPSILRLQGEAT